MITGMENTLKALRVTEVQNAIQAATGQAPASPNQIPALCEGLAKADIPFLTANATITIPAGVATTCPAGAGATAAPGVGTLS